MNDVIIRKSPKRRKKAEPATDSATMRVVGYVRCSDEGQSVSDFNTLDNQKQIIARHVEMQNAMGAGWELTGFYVDDGFSGKDMERPELARLLRDIETGKTQVVVVYKLDRITRSIADFFQMDKLMTEHGCHLVSVKEQFDTATPLGRLVRNVLLAFAQMEREVNSERVRDKMHAEARLGRHLGGGTPYGFDVVDRKLVPNAEEAKVVRIIFEQFVEMRSHYRVRDYINGLGYRTRLRPWKDGTRGGTPWTTQTIEKMLQNPRYKGSYTFDDVEIPGAHEAIVPPDLWELAQKVKPNRSRLSREPQPGGFQRHTYLLQGVVECGHCGTRMTPTHVDHKNSPRHRNPFTVYYECGRDKKFPKGQKCPVGRYNAERLEEAVLGELEFLVEKPDLLAKILETLDASEEDIQKRQRLNEVQEARRAVRGRIENMVEAIAQGTGVMSLAAKLAELERHERALAVEAADLESAIGKKPEPISVEEARSWFRGILDFVRESTPEVRKKIVTGLVRKVEAVDKEKVRVTYNVLPALAPESLSSGLNQCWLPGVDSNHEPSG